MIQAAVFVPDPIERQAIPPRLRDVIVRVAVSLATAVVVPTALFAAALVSFNITTALLVALAWMSAVTVWRWTAGRPVSGLLLLALGIMTLKTGITLATGNTFIYFVQPVLVDLVVGTVFLGSLCSHRPIVTRLASDFYPINPEIAERCDVRALFRGLTLMWGLVILAKGTITMWLLVSLSTISFVLIKGGAIITLTLTAAAVTVVWSVIIGRQGGLLRDPTDRLSDAASS